MTNSYILRGRLPAHALPLANKIPERYNLVSKLLIVLSLVLAFSCSGFSSTGLPNEISNIQFQNVTQTSVDVVWTTVHPSTSQVLLSRDTNYETERLIPAVPNTALVTSHRVTVNNLVPYNSASGTGQYYIYVASVTGSGQMSTAPGPQNSQGTAPLLSMRTLPTNLAGSPNTLVYASGPTTAYTGYDTYFRVQPILVSGPVGHLYIQNTGGYNNGTDGTITGGVTNIGVHFICSKNNPTGVDSADQWYNATTHLGYCYKQNSYSGLTVRLRVPANTPPGPYTVTVTLISNGQNVVVTYPFTVVQTPTSITTVAKTVTDIPGLANWETQMTSLGNKWCTYRDAQDAQGNFEAFGWEGDAWFYDGGRVFEQIDDYTANILNQPNHTYWQHCSQAVLYPYAYYLAANNGAMQGWRMFPYGMLMNYWRTHNMLMLDAVTKLATTGTYSANSGTVSTQRMREAAYTVNVFIAYAQAGGPVSPLLQRNVDKLLGMLIQGTEGTGEIGSYVHPFMVGLAGEALSRWYAFSVAQGTPDYRVVPVMKAALDTLWTTNWNNTYLTYNRLRLPQVVNDTNSQALNNLNAQAYAWLWYMTGDVTERQHAYDLFGHAMDTPGAYQWDGKEFSQEFEFSFDTVRLLQNNGMSYTDPASNSFGGAWPVTTPPTIVGVNCTTTCATGTIGSDHATITWTTYVLATTQVVYGTTTAYGNQTALSDTSGVLSHSATLSGLLPATKYHFRVKSVDMVGNPSQSTDLTFTTP